MDPTPTLLSEELSYTETRHVTGVVPSGNSRGNSGATANNKGYLRVSGEIFLVTRRDIVTNHMYDKHTFSILAAT